MKTVSLRVSGNFNKDVISLIVAKLVFSQPEDKPVRDINRINLLQQIKAEVLISGTAYFDCFGQDQTGLSDEEWNRVFAEATSIVNNKLKSDFK